MEGGPAGEVDVSSARPHPTYLFPMLRIPLHPPPCMTVLFPERFTCTRAHILCTRFLESEKSVCMDVRAGLCACPVAVAAVSNSIVSNPMADRCDPRESCRGKGAAGIKNPAVEAGQARCCSFSAYSVMSPIVFLIDGCNHDAACKPASQEPEESHLRQCLEKQHHAGPLDQYPPPPLTRARPPSIPHP